jgi:hypothetical protein
MSNRAEATVGPPPITLGEYRIATSTTHGAFTIPEAWRGKIVRLTIRGANVWLAKGGTLAGGFEIDRTVTTSLDPKLGHQHDIGVSYDYLFPRDSHVSLGHEADAVGYIEAFVRDFADMEE